MKKIYNQAMGAYKKYERWLLPLTLVVGFIIDFVTFKNIEIKSSFIILAVHILVVGIAILALQMTKKYNNTPNALTVYTRKIAPFFMQFSFGALLSGAFIFYTFSGAVSVSWPLLACIGFLMVSNEVFKEYYISIRVQCIMLFFVLFLTIALILPFLFHSLHPGFFVLSSIVAAAIMTVYVYIVGKVSPLPRYVYVHIALAGGVLLICMNGLYVYNRIPPIPLTLTSLGVYQHVQRIGNDYETIRTDTESFLERAIFGDNIHIQKGESVYVFASIYAPEKLQTTAVHHWQYYNEQTSTWETRTKATYSLTGGRKGGYRGYSVKTNLQEGKWRVFIETPRGQVIGKHTFTVEYKEKSA